MVVVLMQSSKGGGLASAFGGSQVTTMFGARRTSDFLQKATITLAIVFMVVCLVLNLYISKRTASTDSFLQGDTPPVQQQTIPQTVPQTVPDNQQQQQQEQNQQQQQEQNQQQEK
jgi:preprotein translocase subunit SecG